MSNNFKKNLNVSPDCWGEFLKFIHFPVDLMIQGGAFLFSASQGFMVNLLKMDKMYQIHHNINADPGKMQWLVEKN